MVTNLIQANPLRKTRNKGNYTGLPTQATLDNNAALAAKRRDLAVQASANEAKYAAKRAVVYKEQSQIDQLATTRISALTAYTDAQKTEAIRVKGLSPWQVISGYFEGKPVNIGDANSNLKKAQNLLTREKNKTQAQRDWRTRQDARDAQYLADKQKVLGVKDSINIADQTAAVNRAAVNQQGFVDKQAVKTQIFTESMAQRKFKDKQRQDAIVNYQRDRGLTQGDTRTKNQVSQFNLSLAEQKRVHDRAAAQFETTYGFNVKQASIHKKEFYARFGLSVKEASNREKQRVLDNIYKEKVYKQGQINFDLNRKDLNEQNKTTNSFRARAAIRADKAANLAYQLSKQAIDRNAIKTAVSGLQDSSLKAYLDMANQGGLLAVNVNGVEVPTGNLEQAHQVRQARQIDIRVATQAMKTKDVASLQAANARIIGGMGSGAIKDAIDLGGKIPTHVPNPDGTPGFYQLPMDQLRTDYAKALTREATTAKAEADQSQLSQLNANQANLIQSTNSFLNKVGGSSPGAQRLSEEVKNLIAYTNQLGAGGSITQPQIQELANRTDTLRQDQAKLAKETADNFSQDPATRSVYKAFLSGTPISSIDATHIYMQLASGGFLNSQTKTPWGKVFNTALQNRILAFGADKGVAGVEANDGKLTPEAMNKMVSSVMQSFGRGNKSRKLLDISQFAALMQGAAADSLAPRVRAMVSSVFSSKADGKTALSSYQVNQAMLSAEARFAKLPPDQQKGRQGNLTDAQLLLEELNKININGEHGSAVFLTALQSSGTVGALTEFSDPSQAQGFSSFLRASTGVGKDNLQQFAKQTSYYKAAGKLLTQRTDTALQDIVKSFDDPAKYNESLVKLAAIEQTSPQLYTKLIGMIKADPSLSFKTINAAATEFLQEEKASKVTEQAIHDKLASAWELMKKAALWMPEYQRKMQAHKAFQKTKDAIKQGKY